MNALKEIIDGISAILGLLGVILFGYILFMGMVHKNGKIKWFEREKAQRELQGKPNIKLWSGNAKTELPWKDTSLIQGGFTALGLIAILFSYVVIMLLLGAVVGMIFELGIFTIEIITRSIAILMTYPVVMGALFAIVLTISNILRYKLPKSPFFFLFVINLACAISSYFVLKLENSQLVLALQLILLVVVSLYLSYILGMIDGIKDADLETRFSLVSATTIKGDIINKVRLYEKTDTDYRFINDDGIEFVFPSLNIVEIKHFPKKTNEASLPMAKSKPNIFIRLLSYIKKRSPTKRAATVLKVKSKNHH